MPAAALTPRVRILIVCDEVSASDIENGVFTLHGVRQHLVAESLPWTAELGLFLLLSSARQGTYGGKILVINDDTDRAVRYLKFDAAFQEDNELLPLCVDVGRCEFPAAGRYTFQVWFSARDGQDVVKGEQAFYVVPNEE